MRNNIPKGWIMKRFGEVFEFLSTLSLSRSELTYEKTNDEIYNIHYGDIHSKFVFQILDFTKEKELPKIINNKGNNYTFLQEGDLIIADASEDYAGIASCVELKNVNNKKITAGLHTFAVRDNSNLTVNGFRAYILKNDWVFNEVKKLATGSKVYGVSKTNIQNLKILLPPLREQEKIAEILSKWDELIATQSQLIQAKENQKKALMQKLLSGKLRFPGFTDKWEEKTLGEILEYEQPTKYIVENDNYSNKNTIPVLTAGKTFILGFTNETKGIYEGILPVIIFDDFTTANKLVNFKFKVKSSAMKILKAAKANIDITYVFEAIQNLTFDPTDHKRYWISEYSQQTILLPSIKEQKKISKMSILLTNEIETLKTELQSFQTQKKGLMQQLLTGKIRVNFK